jgi:hypothetical protein
MLTRAIGLRGKRRWVAGFLALAGCTTMVAVLATAFLYFNAKTALGSSSGGGGSCFPTSGPVCTFKNNVAFADFGGVSSGSSVSSNSGVGGGGGGCGTFTNVFVQPMQSLTRPGNTASQVVFVSISQYDSCTGMQLVGASNTDPNTFAPDFTGTIQFGTGLSTATVNGTAPMFDFFTGAQVFTTTINVTWQGYGPTGTSIDSSHFRAPGYIVNSHFHGSSRAAEASGTLTDGTGANLATPPTLNADLSNASGGTMLLAKS